MIAIDSLIHMRYVCLICYKKLWSNRPNYSILSSTRIASASASPAVTWLFIIAGQAIIPYMKEWNQAPADKKKRVISQLIGIS